MPDVGVLERRGLVLGHAVDEQLDLRGLQPLVKSGLSSTGGDVRLDLALQLLVAQGDTHRHCALLNQGTINQPFEDIATCFCQVRLALIANRIIIAITIYQTPFNQVHQPPTQSVIEGALGTKLRVLQKIFRPFRYQITPF